MMKKLTKILLGFTLLLGIMACEPITPANSVTITGIAGEKANRSFPTAVKIYALGSDHLFYGYDFFTLTLEPETALGVTLRKVLDEVEIAPGEEVVFGPYELPANTRNIGVIGYFQAGERAQWRDTAPVVPNASGGQEVYIVLVGNRLSALTKEEYDIAYQEAYDEAVAEAEAKAAEEAAAAEAEAKAAEEAKEDS